MGVGAAVLHQTLQGTDDGQGLSLFSVVLAATWLAGWFVLSRLMPPRLPDGAPGRSAILRTHPLLATLTIGAAFAAISLLGALILRELPVFDGEVTGTTARVSDSPAMVFFIALGTGATEELFFRHGLHRVLPRRWFPLVSTIAYGAVTLATGNVALTIAAVMLGATASAAFVATARWYSPVIIHALWTVALVGIFPNL